MTHNDNIKNFYIRKVKNLSNNTFTNLYMFPYSNDITWRSLYNRSKSLLTDYRSERSGYVDKEREWDLIKLLSESIMQSISEDV